MSGRIEILHTDPIERLREAYEALPAIIGDALQQSDDDFWARRRRIDCGRESLVDAIRAAEDALAETDDEDGSEATESLVEELREKLARLDAALERIDLADRRHRAAREETARVRTHQAPSAVVHLCDLLSDIRAYRAVGLEPLGAPGEISRAGSPTPRADEGSSFPAHISGGTREELEHWASQAFEATKGKWPDLSTLNEAQRLGVGAIRFYTRYGYIDMNTARRRGGTSESADVLDWALQNLGFLPPYRGICRRRSGMFEEFGRVYVEGHIVSDPSPFSASIDPIQAQHFGSAINYYIKSKRGRDISYISGFSSEREILFAGNSRFRVLKVKLIHGETSVFLAEL
jgi:hypothetical protein